MAEANKSSPWVWISLFLIISLFVSFIFFLDQKIVNSGREVQQAAQQAEPTLKPKIDFYEVLKQRTIDVPDDRKERVSNKKPAPARDEKKSASLSNKARFVLQAGSFSKPEDAERRKAQLAMLGLESSIARARINGVAYHRVMLGPFADDGFYSKVKNRLITNDIQYIAKAVGD